MLRITPFYCELAVRINAYPTLRGTSTYIGVLGELKGGLINGFQLQTAPDFKNAETP